MYEKILVPVALDHKPNVKQAFDVAEKLRTEGGHVIALHVVETIPDYVENHLPAGQMEENRKEAENLLKSEIGGRKGIAVKAVMGHAGRTIVEFADEAGCDCIVIASHQPGLADYFLGSTAARVVRHAHCAVHVIR